MSTTEWLAPAKLNLFLHVTGRREDGYHRLQTVFQFLDLSDRIRFRLRDDSRIRLRPSLADVEESDNLIVRAAHRLQAAAPVPRGVDIELEKRLPMGGGLGGGSSDAATTLVALNHLWALELSTERLLELGLELGADVPVFVRGEAAWAEGVGERLTPVYLDEPWYLVLDPGCHISTAAIFASAELTRNTPPMTIPAHLLAARGNSALSATSKLMAVTRNDCESVVRQRYAAVHEALRWLAGFGPARMTGTGGCVFAPFSSEAAALEARNAIPPGWTGFVVRGTNRSSLYAAGPG